MAKKDKKPKNQRQAEMQEKVRKLLIEKLKCLNEDRQRRNQEECEKRHQAALRCEACRACSNPGVYFPPPRGQTNIYVKIDHQMKNTQIARLTFMEDAVPAPPCPPLPDLKLEDLSEEDKAALLGDDYPSLPDSCKSSATGLESDDKDRKKRKVGKKRKRPDTPAHSDDVSHEDEEEKPKITRKNFKCPTCPKNPKCPGPIY